MKWTNSYRSFGLKTKRSTGLKTIEHKHKRNCADPWDHDRQAYKGRNVVERVFNRMKHCRKAATRYDRLDATFLANLQLALIAIQLKNTSKTTSVNTP